MVFAFKKLTRLLGLFGLWQAAQFCARTGRIEAANSSLAGALDCAWAVMERRRVPQAIRHARLHDMVFALRAKDVPPVRRPGIQVRPSLDQKAGFRSRKGVGWNGYTF